MSDVPKKTCGDNGGRKRDGTSCGLAPDSLSKNGRCRLHHGRTATGPQVSSWKDGRYSKYWSSLVGPAKVARERVEAEGRAVLSLYEGVATMDVRLAELSALIEQGDSPEWRVRVREAWILARTGDADAVRELDALIERGTARDSAWEEMFARQMQRGQRAENAMALDIRRDEELTRNEVFAALESLIAAVTTTLPAEPCPHCHASADRAADTIRSLSILPNARSA